MQTTDVLVLAGGTLPEEMRKYSAGYDNRALLKIGEKYMIEYIADALRGAPGVGRILVVGLKEPLEKVLGARVDAVMQSGETMLENIKIGLDFFPDSKKLLISTCDIPLITPEIAGRFIAACNKSESDVYYPLVEKKLNDEKYPETKRTYFRLREGVFTGGNLVILNPAALRENWELLEKLIAARKSPLKLVSMIGFGVIISYVFGRLSLEVIERKIKDITGMRGKAVLAADPEIGIDVDKESDYLLVKKHLE